MIRLIKVYGTSPTVLAEYIDRSPKNISDYLFSHTSTDKKSKSPTQIQNIKTNYL